MIERVLKGRVVTASGIVEDGWIAITDGTIVAVGTGDAPEAAEIQDFGSAWLLPGAVDGQTHAGSQIGFAGMAPTTKAAVIGGVTTIVDMPYDHPIPVTKAVVLREKIAAIGEHAVCDVALYGTIPTRPDLSDIRGLIDEGVCAFKISSFEAHPDRFPRIDNSATLVLLKALEGTCLPLGLHNEDQEIVAHATKALKEEGKTGAEYHSQSRPPVAELAATSTFFEVAASTEAHAHIVHISVPEGFEMARAYRERGVAATAEMCVHYLLFDAQTDMPRLKGLLKVNPPIRPGQTEALWGVLEQGLCSFVSSDHSAWPLERKTSASIFDVAAGMPGLEAMVPAFFTAAAKRKDNVQAAMLTAEYLADRPARFFGLSRKGRIAPGFDADIAVLSPEDFVYDATANPDGPGWSAYNGMTFTVRPSATFVRGRKVWDGVAVTDAAGYGRYVPRRS
ncbi:MULTISPECIES: dihydroorotase [unclassified Rhizobium]|uniref:dihydroorotase n=1 Tax=unclassified Rhizobium TaxID=2613769 RepID=UPI001ADA9F5B|nr:MULTISPECIES: amidohydrolase family protein [unclassified Rhizobium]MBO9123984.1 amidohydrolase family protein [Rhizobium sp. 16-488-2b]MBO9174516.1 amidohydrolase family protein [Rhizobium sp. 16-488-2a]